MSEAQALQRALLRFSQEMPVNPAHYHTQEHVRQMLSRYYRDCKKFGLDDHEELLLILAVLYHDIVYVPGALDNEELSARRFREAIGPLMSAADTDEVCRLIESTKVDLTARFKDPLVRILHTLDWEGFTERDRFIRNMELIWREAVDPSGDPERQGVAVMGGMRRFYSNLIQAIDDGYEIDCFDPELTALARKNLQMAVDAFPLQAYVDEMNRRRQDV